MSTVAETWVPRFREACRLQMAARVRSVATGRPAGASAWDGYAATAIAEQIAATLASRGETAPTLAPRPAFYT